VKVAALDYELPERLIASEPCAARDGARLMVLRRSEVEHRQVREFAELVPSNALLIVNDTRVRRARVLGTKRESGGRVELLFLDRLEPGPDGRERWQAIAKSSKPLRAGAVIDCAFMQAEIEERRADGTVVTRLNVADGGDIEAAFERHGRMPIPPYLGRSDVALDAERYQTVFARRTASAAAPTAGLHLSASLLARLEQRGVALGKLELEIGLGTFRPVTSEELDDHVMHSERFEISAELAQAVASARARGGPVVAVGTTVVRALESAADPERAGHVRAMKAETRLLIQPGYRFSVVDALLTNFHVPRSTLLALVAAFAGRDEVLAAYRWAVLDEYRFFSYGDAMWIPERRYS
jgi:S-adenosylmethionine:tRNA ribosyltransferase-isomerase